MHLRGDFLHGIAKKSGIRSGFEVLGKFGTADKIIRSGKVQ